MTKQKNNSFSEKLGDAVFVGAFDNHSDEWHAARAAGIGGSDVSKIVGVNPWESAYTLAAKRLGLIPSEISQNNAMEWGTRLEPVILRKFIEEHPELEIHDNVGTWTHKDRDWQIANPDAIFETEDGELGIVEIKTARLDDWVNDKGEPAVPIYYATQVQWYLQTFGFARAYVAVFFRTDASYKEFVVEADKFEQDTNLAAVVDFKKYLDTQTMPDFSAPFTSTLQTTREMHSEIDDELEVELGDLGMYYSLAVAEAAKHEEHLNELRARVIDAMGKAKRGLAHDVLIVERRARKGGTPFLVNK